MTITDTYAGADLYADASEHSLKRITLPNGTVELASAWSEVIPNTAGGSCH